MFIECTLRRVLYKFRSVHERLAAFELVNGGAFSAQFHDAVAKSYDIREANFIESRSRAQHGGRGGHCLDSFLSDMFVGRVIITFRGLGSLLCAPCLNNDKGPSTKIGRASCRERM